jgi:hypothetical protein
MSDPLNTRYMRDLESKIERLEQQLAALTEELARTQRSAALMLTRLSPEDMEWCRTALDSTNGGEG